MKVFAVLNRHNELISAYPTLVDAKNAFPRELAWHFNGYDWLGLTYGTLSIDHYTFKIVEANLIYR